MSMDAAETQDESVEPVEDSGFVPLGDDEIATMLNEGMEVNDIPESTATPSSDAADDVEPASNEAQSVPDAEALRRTAEELGWATDDLSDFESPEELRWFVRQFDKRSGKAEAPAEVEAPAAKAATETPAKPAEAPVIPGFEWSLDIDEMERSGEYTDTEIATAKHLKAVHDQTAWMRQQMEQSLGGLKQFEEWKAQAEQAQKLHEDASFSNTFHDVVDMLDESRFGRSIDAKGNIIKLADEASANRVKLLEEIELQKLRHARRGEKEPPLSVLAKRAENNLFFDDIIKQTRKKATTSLSNQSRRRQLTPSRGKVSMASPIDPDDPANSPELKKAWAESGMADLLGR